MPPPRLILELSAAPQGIARARSAVTRLCDTINVSDEVKEKIRLAVTEACTNCVLHAYDGNAPTSTYRLEARQDPGEIVVVVQDWGLGLEGDGEDDRRAERVSGRGMAIMQAVATSMEIASAAGLGTRVELRFALA